MALIALKKHTPLLLVLLPYLALLLTYSGLIPLGEAPDEFGHYAYARFIARQGRLPATMIERQAAGYRADWPPLYHVLVAAPLAAMGESPPTQLKSVGDTPRRLLPTDGRTIAAFIHTADEAWPWRGISLAWHVGRLVSVVLALLGVTITYALAWRLTAQRNLAVSAAATHAFVPQAVFISSVLNDDNLLILLSGLILLMLVGYTQQSKLPTPGQNLFLGMLLGLASVAKYSALPLWLLVALRSGWLIFRHRRALHKTKSLFAFFAQHLLALSGGALITASWWFVFVWRNFNQVKSEGLWRGSLLALTAGATDASLRHIVAGAALTWPSLDAWARWFVTFFQSFWGLFGGGGAIPLPTWSYWLLAIICLVALGGLLTKRPNQQPAGESIRFLLIVPPLFLLLPITRFVLSGGDITESAQGRHLFPALPVIALGLTWGLARIGERLAAQVRSFPFPWARYQFGPEIILPAFTFLLSLSAPALIRASYPPPIPLRTTPAAATAQNLLNAKLAHMGGVTLVGYELAPPVAGRLPVTLVWQATAVPPENFLVSLSLNDAEDQPLGDWLGHPLGGRYPTRAWDPGDVLRQTIPLPLLPGLPAAEATLTLRLLDQGGQPAAPPLKLAGLTLPASPAVLLTPDQLRADELAPEAAFSYRSTLSFALPNQFTAPRLMAPDGTLFAPAQFSAGAGGSIAHFLVEARWPSGAYHLSTVDSPSVFIANRRRQFEISPPAHEVNANFAGYLTLLGYDLPRRQVQPGHSFPITLHWRAEKVIDRDLTVFNHLLDRTDVQRGGADRIPQNYYSTVLWVPGEIVSDRYEVPVDATAPPGVYWLDVGLYPSDQPTLSLPRFVAGQPIESNSVRLGPIKVGGPPPGVPVEWPAAQPSISLEVRFDDGISLLGADQPCNLTLYWQPTARPSADYTVFVHVLDQAGTIVVQADGPPAGGAYPTSLWDVGEIIADERLIPLPGDLPPGRYTVQLGLYRPETGERLPLSGSTDGALKLQEFEVE